MSTVGFGQRLNYAMSFNLSAAYGQMYFIDGNGENTNTLSANAGITRRLNARNSASAQYSFSRFDYGPTQAALPAPRKSVIAKSTPRKSALAASEPADYYQRLCRTAVDIEFEQRPRALFHKLHGERFGQRHLPSGTASLMYNHGAMGGSGFMVGAENDAVMANFGRSFGKNLTVGVTGSYMRTSSLVAADAFGICYNANTATYYYCLAALGYTPVTNARDGGVQATRKLGRYFSAFAVIRPSTNRPICRSMSRLPVGVHFV